MISKKDIKKNRRIKRTRAKIFGTVKRPRLTVFKSLEHIYAQLIDDQNSKTIIVSSDFNLNKKNKVKRTIQAFMVGEDLAKKAKAARVEEIVFDKRGYKYHGIIKQLADGARKGGLKF